MYPFRPTKQEGLDRMTTLVRQIGEEQEKQQQQQQQLQVNDLIKTQEDYEDVFVGAGENVIDLSFYQINDHYPSHFELQEEQSQPQEQEQQEQEQSEKTIAILEQLVMEVTNSKDQDLNRLSQCTILNLSYNYLVDPYLFAMAKYDNILLKHLSHVREMDLSHNDFKSMPVERFQGSCIQSLEKLDLSYNRLQSFALKTRVSEAQEAISISTTEDSFSQLKWLNLAHNSKLSELPRNLAQLIPNIVELNLSFASLTNDAIRGLFIVGPSTTTTTTTTTINALNSLRVLNLSHNKLTGDNFPSEITNPVNSADSFIALPSLEELYLDENQIVSLSDQWLFDQAGAKFGSTLKILSLSFNKLNNLNSCLFNENIFEQLQKLHVDNNMIESVPVVIKHDNSERVSQMVELRLGNNKISCIGQGDLFAKWNQLATITLQNNMLTELPSDIGSLKNIEDLYLFGNNLTTIPETIGDLTQLQELDLYNNQLQTLPTQIGRLVALKRLNLDNNQLQTIPNDIVNLSQLQVFTFRDNPQLQISPFLMMMRTDK